MVDHVAAVVRVMLLRLDAPAGIFGPRHQRVSPGLLRGQPVKLPTAPCIPANGIYKSCRSPRLATVRAHRDLGYLAFAGPCSAGDSVWLVRRNSFVNPRSGDFGLQFNFS